MEGVITSIITIQITSTSDRGTDKKQVTFYIIEVYNHFSKKSWTIEKRYSEFDALYKIIYKLYPKCPTIPGKSFLGMGLKSQEKEKRVCGRKEFRVSTNKKIIYPIVFAWNP